VIVILSSKEAEERMHRTSMSLKLDLVYFIVMLFGHLVPPCDALTNLGQAGSADLANGGEVCAWHGKKSLSGGVS